MEELTGPIRDADRRLPQRHMGDLPGHAGRGHPVQPHRPGVPHSDSSHRRPGRGTRPSPSSPTPLSYDPLPAPRRSHRRGIPQPVADRPSSRAGRRHQRPVAGGTTAHHGLATTRAKDSCTRLAICLQSNTMTHGHPWTPRQTARALVQPRLLARQFACDLGRASLNYCRREALVRLGASSRFSCRLRDCLGFGLAKW